MPKPKVQKVKRNECYLRIKSLTDIEQFVDLTHAIELRQIQIWPDDIPMHCITSRVKTIQKDTIGLIHDLRSRRLCEASKQVLSGQMDGDKKLWEIVEHPKAWNLTARGVTFIIRKHRPPNQPSSWSPSAILASVRSIPSRIISRFSVRQQEREVPVDKLNLIEDQK
ncbi:unnamed protein product, partial [Mesorhabditis spiculigera]